MPAAQRAEPFVMDHRRTGLVHLAAKALGLDDDAYRAFLKSRVGVTSARDLNAAQFRTIMEEFERLGFKSRRRPRSLYHERLSYWRGKGGYRAGMGSPEQLALAETLEERALRAKDKTAARRKFLVRMGYPADLTWLTADQTKNYINALQGMLRRR